MTDQTDNAIQRMNQLRTDVLKRFQYALPTYEGSLTVRVFTGAGAGDVQLQGQNVYGSSFETTVDTQQAADFLTDINIWSRGGVSTAGVVTPNTTSILVGNSGGPFVPIAPGETITLRKKAPSQLVFKAGKATATADQVVFFW